MHKTLAAAVLALLLAGCAGDTPAQGGEATVGDGDDADMDNVVPYAARPEPMRFAAGDSEGELTGSVTFAPTDTCITECSGNTLRTVDLTSVVPADAPVELVVEVDSGSGSGYLSYVEAGAVRTSEEFTGSGYIITALVTRSAAGQVFLNMYRAGLLSPVEDTAVTYAAHSVVRADLLVPFVPASMKLEPGDRLNLTGRGIDAAVLLAPDGSATVRESAPFTFNATGPAGLYTLMVEGDEATPVYGPNVTMSARRVVITDGPAHDLAPSGPTSWTFATLSAPLAVGLMVSGKDPASGVPGPSAALELSYELTGPDGASVLDWDEGCSVFCGFTFGGSYGGAGSAPFDPHLVAGTYTATVTANGANLQAFEWTVTLA